MNKSHTSLPILIVILFLGLPWNALSKQDDDVTVYALAVAIATKPSTQSERRKRLRELPASVLSFALKRARDGDPEAAWLAGKLYALVLHGQRILSPVTAPLLSLTKRYKPVFTRLAVVKVSLRLTTYQHVPPPS